MLHAALAACSNPSPALPSTDKRLAQSYQFARLEWGSRKERVDSALRALGFESVQTLDGMRHMYKGMLLNDSATIVAELPVGQLASIAVFFNADERGSSQQFDSLLSMLRDKYGEPDTVPALTRDSRQSGSGTSTASRRQWTAGGERLVLAKIAAYIGIYYQGPRSDSLTAEHRRSIF